MSNISTFFYMQIDLTYLRLSLWLAYGLWAKAVVSGVFRYVSFQKIVLLNMLGFFSENYFYKRFLNRKGLMATTFA